MLDVGPVNITGAVKMYRARVWWRDGTLFMCGAENLVKTAETEEPEKDSRGWWKTQLSDGRHIHFSRRGCSTCGWQLGRLNPETLEGKAVPVLLRTPG